MWGRFGVKYLVAALFCATAAQADELKLAVTTSFENAGLAEILLPAILNDTGIEIQLLVVGTGQALRLGEAGDVDAILVHAPAAEQEFVDAGYATHRREIMYNDFVIVGPTKDPAEVTTHTTAVAALTAIHDLQALFVSRGDDSGTHKAELAIWGSTGLTPVEFEAWYAEVGASMGAALNTAAGLNAYIMADRASWLSFGNKADLALLLSGDPALFNQYSFLPVNAERHPHVRADLAATVEDWLTSPVAQALINGYQLEGEQLFTFNAKN